LPLGAAFRQAGRFGQGGSGRGKGGAHCGTDSGVFGIKGLAARIHFAFILSALSAPAVTPAPASPAPMARFRRGTKGAGGGARVIGDLLVKAMAHEPRKSRPGSRTRFQVIVPGAMPVRSASGVGRDGQPWDEV
jgi:hypothetical protein